MCTCVKILLADVANMNTNNIMIRAKKTDIEFNNIKDWIIPCKGPMLKAPVALFALVAIVRCLKSRTTVDAGRCSQCRPSNVHQEEDKDNLKKRAAAEMLPKNLIAHIPSRCLLTYSGFRGLLSQLSVRIENWNGEALRQLDRDW